MKALVATGMPILEYVEHFQDKFLSHCAGRLFAGIMHTTLSWAIIVVHHINGAVWILECKRQRSLEIILIAIGPIVGELCCNGSCVVSVRHGHIHINWILLLELRRPIRYIICNHDAHWICPILHSHLFWLHVTLYLYSSCIHTCHRQQF